ncbi:MAG: DNA polymerase III subunit delta [Oscillospiraceae bacterium]
MGPGGLSARAVSDRAQKLCLPGGEDDFSYHRFDGAELDFQALADAVDAVPFLSERTLIEVRGFDTNKCREEDAQALVQVIGDLPDYCTLVFVMGTDFEPDGRLKTTKAFKNTGSSSSSPRRGNPRS